MNALSNCIRTCLVGLFLWFSITVPSEAQTIVQEIKGVVLDLATKKPIESAIVNIKNTNISTVTNSEGQFVLKIKENQTSESLLVSSIGYSTKEITFDNLKISDNTILLMENFLQLTEVNLNAFKDARNLVRKVFENKVKNYLNEPVLMTAFYRETIKKRNKNVSLTEAVVYLNKMSYASDSNDEMKIHKARKSTDYKRIDTLTLKLQGGPFSTLYLDIMKYPEYIFTDSSIDEYNFSFGEPSSVNNKPVYVVNFKQNEAITTLGYKGTLYIDAQSFALTSASYGLDLEGKASSKDFLVEKKPSDVEVYPLEASYKVDYREKDGRWYYGYGRVELTFKVNKRRKLFNSVYTISSEMAITDWQMNLPENQISRKDRLRPSMILQDAISGFSDPNFWGEYNLIEPEKSIESAIDKIRRKMIKPENEAL